MPKITFQRVKSLTSHWTLFLSSLFLFGTCLADQLHETHYPADNAALATKWLGPVLAYKQASKFVTGMADAIQGLPGGSYSLDDRIIIAHLLLRMLLALTCMVLLVRCVYLVATERPQGDTTPRVDGQLAH